MLTIHKLPFQPITRRQPGATAATALIASLVLLGACATRSADVQLAVANPAEFAVWDCARIDDELDTVQQRAADVAYAVDERAGNNILALSVGVTLFWPAILAMRPDGLEAADLARLKGRFEALRTSAADKHCPNTADAPSAARAASLPLSIGEKLVYEERASARGPVAEWGLRLTAVRRSDMEYRIEAARSTPAAGQAGKVWRQDRNGNIVAAPNGALQWPRLLRGELALGAVTAGDIIVAGDANIRARMRGQVVAVGHQTVAGRRFDVAVVELFGDTQNGDDFTRVDGAIVVDRVSGVLLRLDLRSASGTFSLQRRLVRVEPA